MNPNNSLESMNIYQRALLNDIHFMTACTCALRSQSLLAFQNIQCEIDELEENDEGKETKQNLLNAILDAVGQEAKEFFF